MDRISRYMANSKQGMVQVVRSQPAISTLREGQEVIYITRDNRLARYRKEQGRLWISYMSSNQNQLVDRDLSVKGITNLSNKMIINNYPAFSVYQHTSVDAQAIADDTFTRIILNSEYYDNGGNWSTSNYRFTVPYNGIYHFDATVLLDNDKDTDAGDFDAEERLDVALFKNDGNATPSNATNRIASSLHLVSGTITDNFWQGRLSIDLKLDTDDFIELVIKQDTGVEQHTHEPTDGDFTFFTGHLVCAL